LARVKGARLLKDFEIQDVGLGHVRRALDAIFQGANPPLPEPAEQRSPSLTMLQKRLASAAQSAIYPPRPDASAGSLSFCNISRNRGSDWRISQCGSMAMKGQSLLNAAAYLTCGWKTGHNRWAALYSN